MPPRVNLFSDTQTTPTAGMRRAMAEAAVGDEQLGADPTVNALCERVADLLGMEAAVFLPSGTMCNEIAIRLHIRPGGDAAFMHRLAHPLRHEAGGPAAISGAVIAALDGDRGTFTAEALEAALFSENRYAPRNRLVCVEQPTYGHVWSLDGVRAVLGVARGHDMRTHLDGARLMNAVVDSGIGAAEWADGFDTAWIDFTKGLGAPVGAVLAGSGALIEEAWRHKQMLGGAMRQAGIVAAGALYALDHHVDRLAQDHVNAAALADGLRELGLDVQCETNIVVAEVPDARAFIAAMAERGVDLSPLGPTTVRAVTHLDVSPEGVGQALDAARTILWSASSLG